MTMGIWLDRGQRRQMKRILRKSRSRIEAFRARVLLLLHGGHDRLLLAEEPFDLVRRGLPDSAPAATSRACSRASRAEALTAVAHGGPPR